MAVKKTILEQQVIEPSSLHMYENDLVNFILYTLIALFPNVLLSFIIESASEILLKLNIGSYDKKKKQQIMKLAGIRHNQQIEQQKSDMFSSCWRARFHSCSWTLIGRSVTSTILHHHKRLVGCPNIKNWATTLPKNLLLALKCNSSSPSLGMLIMIWTYTHSYFVTLFKQVLLVKVLVVKSFLRN